MKKSYIFAIVVIAIAIAIMVSTAGDASSYVTFQIAKNSNAKIHVVGKLKKNENGQVQGIYPSEDKLSFSFLLVDTDGTTQKVHYNEPMPADFQRSDQVVIIGSFDKDVFVADKILLKCPSKYQEEQIKVTL